MKFRRNYKRCQGVARTRGRSRSTVAGPIPGTSASAVHRSRSGRAPTATARCAPPATGRSPAAWPARPRAPCSRPPPPDAGAPRSVTFAGERIQICYGSSGLGRAVRGDGAAGAGRSARCGAAFAQHRRPHAGDGVQVRQGAIAPVRRPPVHDPRASAGPTFGQAVQLVRAGPCWDRCRSPGARGARRRSARSTESSTCAARRDAPTSAPGGPASAAGGGAAREHARGGAGGQQQRRHAQGQSFLRSGGHAQRSGSAGSRRTGPPRASRPRRPAFRASGTAVGRPRSASAGWPARTPGRGRPPWGCPRRTAPAPGCAGASRALRHEERVVPQPARRLPDPPRRRGIGRGVHGKARLVVAHRLQHHGVAGPVSRHGGRSAASPRRRRCPPRRRRPRTAGPPRRTAAAPGGAAPAPAAPPRPTRSGWRRGRGGRGPSSPAEPSARRRVSRCATSSTRSAASGRKRATTLVHRTVAPPSRRGRERLQEHRVGAATPARSRSHSSCRACPRCPAYRGPNATCAPGATRPGPPGTPGRGQRSAQARSRQQRQQGRRSGTQHAANRYQGGMSRRVM